MNGAATYVIAAFVIFAGGAYLGVRGLELVFNKAATDGEKPRPFDDRLVGALALVSGFVGAYNVTQSITPASLVLVGAVCIVLDYACCADLRAGRVPVLLGFPIAIVAAAMDVINKDPISVVTGVMIALPFAFASFTTKGRSGGYGDAGIAALGGFVLGVQLGIIAVAVACFAAAGAGFAMKRQGGTVPFAPFLALTLQFALFVPALRSFQYQ